MKSFLPIVSMIFLLVFCDVKSQNIIIQPANNSYSSKNSLIHLEWNSEGEAVDLYYSIDGAPWILEASQISDEFYDFMPPAGEYEYLDFKIEYTVSGNSRLVWEKLNAHVDEVRTAVISPKGSYVYSGSKNNSLKKWDVAADQVVWENTTGETDDLVYDIDINSSGDTLVVARNSIFQILDEDGNQIFSHDRSDFNGNCRSVEYSPVGGIAAYGTSDGTLNILKLQPNGSFQVIKNYELGAENAIYAIDISNDGIYLAFAGRDGSITVINLVSQNFDEFLFPVSNSLIWDVKISPNNRYLVYGDVSSNVGKWKLAEEMEVFREPHHSSHVRSIAYHPLGSTFLSGSLDGNAIEYDNDENNIIRVINHGGPILDVDYSSTGDTILTTGRDLAIRLWGGVADQHFDDSIRVNIADELIVYIQDEAGLPGDIRDFKVILEQKQKHETRPYIASFDIKFPLKLIEPIDENYAAEGDWGIIRFEDEIEIKTGVIYQFKGKLLQGDIAGDSLYLEDFALVNNTYDINTDNGYVEIIQTCPGSGERWINVSGPIETFQLKQNPVHEELAFDANFIIDGNYELDLLNSEGNSIKNIFNGESSHGKRSFKIDLSNVEGGMYFLRMQFER